MWNETRAFALHETAKLRRYSLQSRRQGEAFVGLVPKQSFKYPKLKYETLEISGVFINPYSVLSFMDRAVLPLSGFIFSVIDWILFEMAETIKSIRS